MQEVGWREPAVEKVSIRNVFAVFQKAQKAPKKQRFPGAHFPGDDNKTLMSTHAVVKRGQCFIVPWGGHEAIWIRRKIKRVS